MKRGKLWRWVLVDLLDRLPGQCTADLEAWAGRVTMQRWPWSPISPGCRQACACGKLAGPDELEAARLRHPAGRKLGGDR